MSDAIFEQAPMKLITRFTLGDGVALVTFPVGNPPVSYHLEAKIVEVRDNDYVGEITKVDPVGRDSFEQHHFHIGGHVEFLSENIMANAP
ncbi:hypothetical protein [Rouxiella chamberiensis]|uniref:hypothetical protein n=1 Tax=Rouxiella chamberiensis TaxID=1513468 RepID=UPI0005D3184C|nr:hypothetical protein [Rouxiella chamberiensis]